VPPIAFTGPTSPTVHIRRSHMRRPAAVSFSSSTCQTMRNPPSPKRHGSATSKTSHGLGDIRPLGGGCDRG
jgi:hypothetical protein